MQAFDEALCKWTESNQGIFEGHADVSDSNETLHSEELHQAASSDEARGKKRCLLILGNFLVTASAMWRIMKRNLETARDELLPNDPAAIDMSSKDNTYRHGRLALAILLCPRKPVSFAALTDDTATYNLEIMGAQLAARTDAKRVML
eukprot:scaffold122900_cov48-Prasinocladus_malaysianus.AAC.2